MIQLPMPKDLTPVQRAALKLASHFIIIAVFNALLSGYVYFTQAQVINWNTFLVTVFAQVALAVLDALKKYMSAKGDLPLSVLVQYASQQVETNAPKQVLTAPQETVKEAVTNMVLTDLNQQGTPTDATAVNPPALQ